MHAMMFSVRQLLRVAAVAATSLCLQAVDAAVPGITGPSFNLVAAAGRISQPDGASVYAWGYGCNGAPTSFAPTAVQGANCPSGAMQLPGPTLIVNQGDTVTVTLTNNLPAAAGNTSILFPGFQVTATNGAPGVLTREAPHGYSVTYSFVASTPGTHSYYSGTRGDLQIEMGLYGALIVLPKLNGGIPTGYTTPAGLPVTCRAVSATSPSGQTDFRLAAAAYDNPAACYDREYLFQFSEMDPRIHVQADQQSNLSCASPTGCMTIAIEPYKAAYFMINGRSMPDDMDSHYAVQYPNQPYNGNPHMHPGEITLLRIIGQGRMQHPFHEHGNHVRLLARDGNLLLSQTQGSNSLAGPLLFTTTTTPGITLDGVYQWTAKGLNWDVYGHVKGGTPGVDTEPCYPDANGYYTTASNPPAPPTAHNYYEWCLDHEKPLEAHAFGDVGSGGPVTLPDPNVLQNGAWYSGSPYLGPDATQRAVGNTPLPPTGTIANSPKSEAGFAFMWHSHNEREITTDNIFPGGMLMMMLVDPWVYVIDESN